ncbi:MAG: hypothetical protein ACYTX0_62185, partial [Nostoc sp.]
RRLGGAERNPIYIRMLGIRMLRYAKPPTPLATTLLTRATQWLPNLQFFCNIFLDSPLQDYRDFFRNQI